MKKILALVLSLVMLLALTACNVESSHSSTVTTTVTSNGQTTTTTTTNDNGVETTETTVTSESDEPTLEEKWANLFVGGAEGTNANGDNFDFAFDDIDNLGFAAMIIVNADKSQLIAYDIGDVVSDDEWLYIEDLEGENELPFAYTSNEVENGFELVFQDNDTAVMTFVDQDTIITDMLALVRALYE